MNIKQLQPNDIGGINSLIGVDKATEALFVCHSQYIFANQLFFAENGGLFYIESDYGKALIGFNILHQKLICTPHSSYGFFWIEKPEHAKSLFLSFIQHIKADFKFKHWEVRTTFPLSDFFDNQKVLTYKKISIFDDYWNGISSNLRRKIRKSEQFDFKTFIGGLELLEEFYPIYRKHIQSLGSFALPKSYLKTLLTQLGQDAEIVIVKKENEIVGGAFCVKNYAVYENVLFVPLRKYRHAYVSDYMHHQMIKNAINQGFTIYSFGRSTKDSSVYRYKQNWNVDNQQLYWNTDKENKLNVRYLQFPKKIIPYIPQFMYQKLCDIVVKKIV